MATDPTTGQPIPDDELRKRIAASAAQPPRPSIPSPNAIPPAPPVHTMPAVTTPISASPSVLPQQPNVPSPVKPQNSLWQKLGHGLERAGNVAGDILAPGTMAYIPGTDMHKDYEQNRAAKLAATGARTGLENAQATNQTAEAWKAMHPIATTPFEAYTQQTPGQPPDLGKWFDMSKPDNKQELPAEIAAWQKDPKNANRPLTEYYKDKAAAEAAGKPDKPDTANQDREKYENIITQGTKASPQDAAWAKAYEKAGTLGPAASASLRQEPGSYVPVPDPSDPIHKIIGWVDPKSGHFRSLADIPGMAGNNEIRPTGQAASREEQATVIGRAGDGLIQSIQSNRAKLGNISAIISSAFLGTPLADPAQSGLATEIASFAALQPAMHGFRGTDALKQFEKIIGGIPDNPDAMVASIKAIQKTAGYFNPNQKSAGNAPQRPPGVPDNAIFDDKTRHWKIP